MEEWRKKSCKVGRTSNQGHPILCFEECQGTCKLKWVGVCVCFPVNSAQVVRTWTLFSHKGRKVWKKQEKKPWSKSLLWFGSLAQGSQAFQASVYSENSWSKQHCYFNFLIKLLWFLQPTVTKAAECKTVLDIILHLCTEQHSEHTVDAQHKLVECPIL